MNKKEDLLGRRFGRLIVVREDEAPSRATRWICTCDCGISKSFLASNLKIGRSQSCGCLAREVRANSPHKTIHGMNGTPEQRAWVAMKQRCKNPKNPQYKHYGARGISVCYSWDRSFENFIRDMGSRPNGTSLDRIDNNAGYTKENCKWSSIDDQLSNRRITRKIHFNGELIAVSKVAKQLGISRKMITDRLDRGVSEADAVRIERWVRPPTVSIQGHP